MQTALALGLRWIREQRQRRVGQAVSNRRTISCGTQHACSRCLLTCTMLLLVLPVLRQADPLVEPRYVRCEGLVADSNLPSPEQLLFQALAGEGSTQLVLLGHVKHALLSAVRAMKG